jgi:hypothetical protein
MLTHGLLVEPNYELARLDAGTIFENDGKLYMVVRHGALRTEIVRMYWFDMIWLRLFGGLA